MAAFKPTAHAVTVERVADTGVDPVNSGVDPVNSGL